MSDDAKKSLIAQCGMNCGLCKRYLAYVHQFPLDKYKMKGKTLHCKGCKPRNRDCGIIKKKCPTGKIYEVDFCSECEMFPCDRLKRLDGMYRKKYGYSMVNNLIKIKEFGLDRLIEEQELKYKCPKCGDTVCVHDKLCYDCDKDRILGADK